MRDIEITCCEANRQNVDSRAKAIVTMRYIDSLYGHIHNHACRPTISQEGSMTLAVTQFLSHVNKAHMNDLPTVIM